MEPPAADDDAATMRAAVVRRYAGEGGAFAGAVEVDEARPVPPAPGPRQVLVRVHAAALNPVCWKWARGRMHRLPGGALRPPYVPGFDLAGEVLAAGSKCRRVRPGQLVWGMAPHQAQGALAELALLDEACVAAKPAGLTFAEAASLPLVSLTVLQALEGHGALREGARVVVLGGSGGAGTAAVQVARALGAAEVVATCSARNAAAVLALGAARTVDGRADGAPPWWEQLDGAGADLVLDTVGGVEAWRRCRGVLRPRGGRFVTIAGDTQGASSLGRLARDVGSVVARKFKSLFGGPGYAYFAANPRRPAQLDRLAAWADEGRLRPVVERVYPLAEVAAAFEHVAAGHTVGKVVVAVTGRAHERA